MFILIGTYIGVRWGKLVKGGGLIYKVKLRYCPLSYESEGQFPPPPPCHSLCHAYGYLYITIISLNKI